MNRNRLLFVQIQILPPNMNRNWKSIIDILCKQPMEYKRDQLLTKGLIELQDNSIVQTILS